MNDDEQGKRGREERTKNKEISEKKISAYNDATEQLQELWSGLTDEVMTKLTNTISEAGVKQTPPVHYLNELTEEMKLNPKVQEVDGKKFKLPLSNTDRAELRKMLFDKAKK